MTTLNNHTLLYDKDCPLCNLYTSAFINTKMLDKKGRKSYGDITTNERSYIDVKRAANEIALVDRNTKKVFYGIDSLLKVIGNSFPIIEKIGNTKPVNYFLKKFYSFISYNRKVIIPSEKKEEISLECVPDFNIKFRLVYILFSVFVIGCAFFQFSGLVNNFPLTNLQSAFIIAFGQIVFQLFFLLKKNLKANLNYIGNLMTVSLLGCIGLLQTMLLNMIIPLPQTIILISFLGIIGFMFFEHKRRVALLELPSYLSYTWIIYRLIALLIILNI